MVPIKYFLGHCMWEFRHFVLIFNINPDIYFICAGTNYWRNRILKVAKNFADDFTFSISAKDDFQHELNEYGYDYVAGDKPIVFAKDAKNRKFVLKEDFS